MSEITVPRGALIGAALLIGFTVTAITTSRHYDVGRPCRRHRQANAAC